MNIGIILAGGIGKRFGGDIPKQYFLLKGKEIISYSIDAFKSSKTIDKIIVVLDEEEYQNGRISKTYEIESVCGGSTRNQSFKNALDYIHENYPNCSKIIENNAACPMITPELIDMYIGFLDSYDCVTTAYKITDALGRYDNEPAIREEFYLIQAPDAYRFSELYKYFDVNSSIIHPACQLPKSRKEYLYFGYDDNIKITYPNDIRKAEDLLNERMLKD